MAHLRTALALVLIVLCGGGAARAATTSPAPPRARLAVVLPLVADDAGLQAFVRSVSTPGSPAYGAYEPVSVLAARFGASPAARAGALHFLRRAGARDAAISPTGMFASATLSVGAAEAAFRTRLEQVRTSRGRWIAPAASLGAAGSAAIRLPVALRGVAAGVIGLDTEPLARSFAHARSPRAHAAAATPSGYSPASGTPGGCAAGIGTRGFTPQQYLGAYGYAPLHAAGLAGQGQKVALVEIDGFRSSDIRTYARCFGLHIPKLTTYAVSGRRLAPGPETTLDLEVLDSAAPRLSEIEVFENATAADVNRSLVLPLLVPGAKPAVISVSLGICEPALYRAFGLRGVVAIERDVELAAASGITVVSASGDSGSEGCMDRQGNPVAALAVQYPASSPDVTAVGGTNLHLAPDNSISSQVVWNDGAVEPGAGGGGLSALFRRPAYQGGTVHANRRSLPDVALLSDAAPGYAVYCTASGTPSCSPRHPWETIGGTSAAAPLFAAGAALVDQDLRRHHRELLGFANPLIYTLARSPAGPGIFSDVTQSDNDLGPFLAGNHGASLACCRAAPGFDQASGWGGVNLAALDAAALIAKPAYGDVSIAIPRGQRPLRHRGLAVTVGCSQACRVYAFAAISLSAGSGGFVVRSKTVSLGRRGRRSVGLAFSGGQSRAIESALRHHRRVQAEAFAVGVGPRGEAAVVTAGVLTAIRG